MIHGSEFRKSIGAPDERFNAAMDRALLQISKEERRPQVKSKIRLSLIAAIIAAIALTGAALALGMNLFEYFGKHDHRLAKLAPQAELATSAPNNMESEALGITTASFNSVYFDGESLIIAFTLENSRRFEAFEPSAEMLARMEKVDPRYCTIPWDENTPGNEAVDAYCMAVNEGKPAGIAYYCVYPSDNCTTGDGIDLSPWMEKSQTLPDGDELFLREFESPLPEGARNQDSLDLHIKLWKARSYYYFDGKDYYELYEARQSAGEISTAAKRTEAIFKKFTGNGEYRGSPVGAQLEISAARASLILSAEQLIFDDPGEDCWYDVLLVDENGTILQSEEVDFSGKEAMVSFRGSGMLPERLTIYLGIDKEGEWSRDDFMDNAAKIDLKQVTD